jgi:hypothetical protein
MTMTDEIPPRIEQRIREVEQELTEEFMPPELAAAGYHFEFDRTPLKEVEAEDE